MTTSTPFGGPVELIRWAAPIYRDQPALVFDTVRRFLAEQVDPLDDRAPFHDSDARLYVVLGLSAFLLERFDAATSYLGVALELNTMSFMTSTTLCTTLMFALIRRGRAREAVGFGGRALSLRPDLATQPEIWRLLAEGVRAWDPVARRADVELFLGAHLMLRDEAYCRAVGMSTELMQRGDAMRRVRALCRV